MLKAHYVGFENEFEYCRRFKHLFVRWYLTPHIFLFAVKSLHTDYPIPPLYLCTLYIPLKFFSSWLFMKYLQSITQPTFVLELLIRLFPTVSLSYYYFVLFCCCCNFPFLHTMQTLQFIYTRHYTHYIGFFRTGYRYLCITSKLLHRKLLHMKLSWSELQIMFYFDGVILFPLISWK